MSDEQILEELKKIRQALEPKPVPPSAAAPKGFWPEFKEFMSKYKVLALAVGFIIGLYLGIVVQSLSRDLLLPTIGLIIPGIDDLATYSFVVDNQTFGVGNFMVALLTFVIVALVIFGIIKVAKRWDIT